MKALLHAAKELVAEFRKPNLGPWGNREQYLRALEDEIATQECIMKQDYIAVDIAIPNAYGNGVEAAKLLIPSTDVDLINKLLSATVVRERHLHDYTRKEIVVSAHQLTLSKVIVDVDKLPSEQDFLKEQEELRAKLPKPATPPIPPPESLKGVQEIGNDRAKQGKL